MAIDVTLSTISSGYNTSKINANDTAIKNALQNAVSRTGTGPNQMEADFDLNGNDVLNARAGQFTTLSVNGVAISASAVGIDEGNKGEITVAGGTWTVNANAITTNKIADVGVTEAKIANQAITFAKLSPALVQTDVDVSPSATADNEIPTVKRVGTLINSAVGTSVAALTLSNISGDLPITRVTGKKVYRTTTIVDHDISYVMSEVPLFRKKIFIPTTGTAFISWQVDFEHRGIDAGAPHGIQYPVGLAGYAVYRRATTEAGLTGAFTNILGTLGAGQVLGRDHHYTTCGSPPRSPFTVEGGYWYEMSLALTAHTDAGTMSGVDGAAQICPNGGTNSLMWEYEPGATIEP